MTTRVSTWRAVLETQWKWTRGLALLGVGLCFALPLLSLRMAADTQTVAAFIATMQAWGVGYAITAATMGLAVAMTAWTYDHRLRHVYALSLPIPRWQYVLLRFGAGLATLAIPVIAVFVAAEIATHSALVPSALHGYPIALTLRFALALLVGYSLFFAVAAGTPRSAGYILGTVGLLIVSQIVLDAANVDVSIVSHLIDVVFAAPGLLAVFAGRWTLIDV